jgi:hypothetical protein
MGNTTVHLPGGGSATTDQITEALAAKDSYWPSLPLPPPLGE